MRRFMMSSGGRNREHAYKPQNNTTASVVTDTGSRKQGLERIVADFKADKITRTDLVSAVREYFYTKYK